MIGGSLGPRIRWWSTDRVGGVSAAPYDRLNLGAHVGDDRDAVRANRDRLADTVGVASRCLVTMVAAHGAEVAVVAGPEAGEVPGVDALVTRAPGLALLALGADCALVVLAEPAAGVVGAVHCGWRGLVADVAGAAVRAMVAQGADPARIEAVLGPAICGRCYAVPPDRVTVAAAACPEAVARSWSGEPALDLRAGLRAGLGRRGVRVRQVGGCTAEDPRLYSFRRDGVTGRQGMAVAIRPGDRVAAGGPGGD